MLLPLMNFAWLGKDEANEAWARYNFFRDIGYFYSDSVEVPTPTTPCLAARATLACTLYHLSLY